jgi:hypothetical protein
LFRPEKSTQENPAISMSTPAGIGTVAPYAVVLHRSVIKAVPIAVVLTPLWHHLVKAHKCLER